MNDRTEREGGGRVERDRGRGERELYGMTHEKSMTVLCYSSITKAWWRVVSTSTGVVGSHHGRHDWSTSHTSPQQRWSVPMKP